MTPSLSTRATQAILLDIEGTTTPIAFVHEVLFAYARSQVRTYLLAHSDEAEVTADLDQLRQEHAADLSQNLQPPALVAGEGGVALESMAGYVEWLIDRDRKSTALKSLQGKIWKQGYAEGTLKSQIFADVPPALERWRRAGLKIGIFSSGSVQAQQLLFAYSEAGDLTGFISNYFDTRVGSKTAAQSYLRIAAALSLAASEVLFISDVVAELAAANEAGMQTRLCVRPGNQPQTLTVGYQTIRSFAEISN
jgi:enolase-phosphatase E1